MRAQLTKTTLAASAVLATIFTFSCATSKPSASSNSHNKANGSSITCSANARNTNSCAESYNSETHYCYNGTVKKYGSMLHTGQTYKYVEIGDQIWMAENFNYHAPMNSLCYDDKQENCKKYGRLYNSTTAQKICPKGWRLPSEADWEKLVEFAGGTAAGCKLKAKNGWDKNSTDEYGFSAIPGGQVASSNTGSKVTGFGLSAGLALAGAKAGSKSFTNAALKDAENSSKTMFKDNFKNGNSHGYWWSSTAKADKNFYYSMDNKSGNVIKNVSTDKTEMYSVRCVSNEIVSYMPVTNSESPTTEQLEPMPEETADENETSQTNDKNNVE